MMSASTWIRVARGVAIHARVEVHGWRQVISTSSPTRPRSIVVIEGVVRRPEVGIADEGDIGGRARPWRSRQERGEVVAARFLFALEATA